MKRVGIFFDRFPTIVVIAWGFIPGLGGVRKHSTAMKSSKTKGGFDSFWWLVVVENEELTNSFHGKSSQPMECHAMWFQKFQPRRLGLRPQSIHPKASRCEAWIWWKMQGTFPETPKECYYGKKPSWNANWSILAHHSDSKGSIRKLLETSLRDPSKHRFEAPRKPVNLVTSLGLHLWSCQLQRGGSWLSC